MQLFVLPDGTLQLNAYLNGMVTELVPNAEWAALPLGFYDMDGNPVPDPLGEESL